MLSEVKLVVTPKAARLTVTKGDDVVEDETWTFDRSIGSTEAAEVTRALFDDAYDVLQTMVHGDAS